MENQQRHKTCITVEEAIDEFSRIDDLLERRRDALAHVQDGIKFLAFALSLDAIDQVHRRMQAIVSGAAQEIQDGSLTEQPLLVADYLKSVLPAHRSEDIGYMIACINSEANVTAELDITTSSPFDSAQDFAAAQPSPSLPETSSAPHPSADAAGVS